MEDTMRRALIDAATKVREQAHAPYSGFKVGAALLTSSGKVYTAANVENAAYSPSLCAERGALSAAVSAGERTMEAIAIVTEGSQLCPPCGVCRQALSEFGTAMIVILAHPDGTNMSFTLEELFPHHFGSEFLDARPG
jgi:cytidine deaminase